MKKLLARYNDLSDVTIEDITPLIIEDESKAFYYRGLSEFESERGYLRDTCLSMQDLYKVIVDKYIGSLLS